MRERITAIIAIFLLLILIAASYWYAMKSTYGNLKYLPSEDSPDFIATGATVVSFDNNGIAKNKVKAKDFQHFSNDRVTMEKPEYTSVSPNEPVTHAKADHGQSDDGGATVYFQGNVEITRAASDNSDITRLQTQSLMVETDTNHFETNDFVHITNGENTATAVGMTLDNMERNIELKSRVKTISLPKAGNVDLLPHSK